MSDEVCGRCGGAGQIILTDIDSEGRVTVEVRTCPGCGGSGRA